MQFAGRVAPRVFIRFYAEGIEPNSVLGRRRDGF
jgi:hypothetical protein